MFEKLDIDLTTLIIKCKFFGKPYNLECVKKEKELRILAKKKNKWNKKIKRWS